MFWQMRSGKFFLHWFAMLIRTGKKKKNQQTNPKTLAPVLEATSGNCRAVLDVCRRGQCLSPAELPQHWGLLSSGPAVALGHDWVALGDYIFKLISAWQFLVLYKWINQKCLVAFCTLLHAEGSNRRILEYWALKPFIHLNINEY